MRGVKLHIILIGCLAVSGFSLSSGVSFGQTDFYYSCGRKIDLETSARDLVVKLELPKRDIVRFIEAQSIFVDTGLVLPQRPDFLCLTLREGVKDIKVLIDSLKNKEEIEIINPVYYLKEGREKWIVTDEFIIQFKPEIKREEIDAFNYQHKVEIVKEKSVARNLFILRVTKSSDLDVLSMANLYHESELTEWSHPNFIAPIKIWGMPPDPFFNYQYNFHNIGQEGGTVDADIDAPGAWDMTKGSSDIIVAVIDKGVDLNHEDLPSSRLVTGYDFYDDDNDPSPGDYQAHGTACAGLIAASHNNKGIAGLAPNCKIMPIKIFSDEGQGGTTEQVADAIDFAWENGADVLSNSWSMAPATFVASAIKRAVTNGRSGLGTVVVFSAGNTYGYLSFPANLDDVIAVGAIDRNNIRWNYSAYGNELDVVAPSGDLCYGENDFRGDVWTMDISGHLGWNPTLTGSDDANGNTNYTGKFGGTSAAAPQVAGISALILSVDPDLEESEVRNIIQQTADDLGPTGWDKFYGWGRVNACRAVAEVHPDYEYIDSDVTWNYPYHATKNIIVLDEATLTLSPGMEIYFDGGKGLIVYGDLVAGGPYTPSLFTSSSNNPGPGSWGGIWIYNNPESHSLITRALIQYATYGIHIVSYSSRDPFNRYSPIIDYCEISNNKYGIYCWHATADIYENVISNNTSVGIAVYSSSKPDITDNYVKNNAGSYGGIYSSGSTPYIYGNVIRNNQHGVTAYYTPSIVHMGDDCGINKGYNSTYNNSSWEVGVGSGSLVLASGNWWGVPYVPWDDMWIQGTMIASCPLSYDPNSGKMLANSENSNENNSGLTSDKTYCSDASGLLMLGLDYRNAGNYEAAISVFKEVVQQYLQSQEAIWALIELASTYHEAKRTDQELQLSENLYGYLEYIAALNTPGQENANNDLHKIAIKLMAWELFDRGEFNEAVRLFQDLVSLYPDSPTEEEALFDMFNIYLDFLKDKTAARNVLSELESKYPESEFIFHAFAALDENAPFSKENKLIVGNVQTTDSSVLTPGEYNLSLSYPNPFTSTTNIKFAIPKESHVILGIYDVSGRLTRILINQKIEPGYHTVVWDAKDAPPGIYFAKLVTDRYEASKKLVLMK